MHSFRLFFGYQENSTTTRTFNRSNHLFKKLSMAALVLCLEKMPRLMRSSTEVESAANEFNVMSLEIKKIKRNIVDIVEYQRITSQKTVVNVLSKSLLLPLYGERN